MTKRVPKKTQQMSSTKMPPVTTQDQGAHGLYGPSPSAPRIGAKPLFKIQKVSPMSRKNSLQNLQPTWLTGASPHFPYNTVTMAPAVSGFDG